MSPDELLEYRGAVALWIEYYGDIDNTISDQEIWALYRNTKEEQQNTFNTEKPK